MKIVVCVKQVPATDSRIKPMADGSGIDPAGLEYVVNPYDEFAIEEALRIKEKLGGEVVAIGIGGARAEEGLRTCLALGCDRARVLKDESLSGADALTIAGALAAIIKSEAPDLVLTGKQAVDDDQMAVPAMLAELLDWPQATVVIKLEVAADGKSATAEREIEGAVEVIQLPLPAVIAAQKGLNEPRYASLKGIMAAKKKAVEPVDASAVTAGAPAVRTVSVTPPPPRPEGRRLDGDAESQVKELVRLLHEEYKVI
ncbi:MAG TPA: electron transfer flavoprotein subunit beta/FixA family protein [Candidatus Eisenbacteria bacterium]